MTGEIEQNGCISKKQRRIRKPASSSSAAAAAAASTSQQIFQHTLSFLQFPLRKATFSNLSFRKRFFFLSIFLLYFRFASQ